MRFVLIHGDSTGPGAGVGPPPELGRRGHQALAIDMPGHGERVDDESTSDQPPRRRPLSVMGAGDVLVGLWPEGSTSPSRWTPHPTLVGHLIYLAAALRARAAPLPEALTQRDGDVDSRGGGRRGDRG